MLVAKSLKLCKSKLGLELGRNTFLDSLIAPSCSILGTDSRLRSQNFHNWSRNQSHG